MLKRERERELNIFDREIRFSAHWIAFDHDDDEVSLLHFYLLVSQSRHQAFSLLDSILVFNLPIEFVIRNIVRLAMNMCNASGKIHRGGLMTKG